MRLQRDELIESLKKMIVEECDMDIEPDQLSDDDILIGGEFDLDSLDALQIAVAIKSAYGVRVEANPEGRQAMQSIASLADFIIEADAKTE